MGTQFIGAQGEAHHAAKLTKDKVKEMRRLVEDKGLCMKCVATLHGVNYQTAFDAITYRTWRHAR